MAKIRISQLKSQPWYMFVTSVLGAFQLISLNNPGDVLVSNGPESYPSFQSVASSAPLPAGTIMQFPVAETSAPSGWLLCDGRLLSRTDYPDLFASIGTAFGAGDGATNFAIPDLRGRSSVGAGAGAGLTARSLGETGGEETHVLTSAEMAAHDHSLTTRAGTHNTDVGSQGGAWTGVGSANSSGTGSGTAHNNISPYVAIAFLIKVQN